jgi:hypothetical protein
VYAAHLKTEGRIIRKTEWIKRGRPKTMYKQGEELREEVMMRTSECYDIHSSIEEKLERARDLYAAWGERLQQHPHISNLMKQLDQSIEATWKAMFELGVVDTCKFCDEQEGGSCCGAGIENKYDSILLLMNLLLRIPLPEQRDEQDSCFFLGKKGCKLKVRLVLCVDYLCPKLHKKLAGEKLLNLQTVSGDELLTGFILYDSIKTTLRRWNDGH